MKKNVILFSLVCFSLCLGTAFAQQENDALRVIFSRKSVRSYKAVPVSKESLALLVKAGMAAPSAMDKRPWEFIIITDAAVLKQLGEVLPYAKMTQNAAAAIVVVGDTDKQGAGKNSNFWVMDCSAATENILLAAESLGLGAVWTAVYPSPERVSAVRSVLNIPNYCIPLNLIPIGVPVGTEKPKDKYNAAQIHWEKW